MVPFRSRGSSNVGRKRIATADQRGRPPKTAAAKTAKKKAKRPIDPAKISLVKAEVMDTIEFRGSDFAELHPGSQTDLANLLLRHKDVTAVKNPQAVLHVLRIMEAEGLVKLPPLSAVGGTRKKA